MGLTTIIVDPWFNFRATKYLVQHGFYSFWDWFDDSEFPQLDEQVPRRLASFLMDLEMVAPKKALLILSST